MQHQFASGGTDGWLGGAVLECRPSSALSQYLMARNLVVQFPLPRRSRKTCSARLVHHRDDPTSTANQLVSGDLLHLECLQRSRHIALSDMVQGRFLGEIVENTLRQLYRQILRHVAMVVDVGTGRSALYRNAPVSIRAAHVGG